MGKTSKQTQVQNINQGLENEAANLFAMLRSIAQMGYNPYTGGDIADFTPAQRQAMENTNQAASAFGMGTADYGGPTGAVDGAFSSWNQMMKEMPDADRMVDQINNIFTQFSKQPKKVKQKSSGGGKK